MGSGKGKRAEDRPIGVSAKALHLEKVNFVDTCMLRANVDSYNEL